MKQYGKNWWINKGETEHWFCPVCGDNPKIVLYGKHILYSKHNKHKQVIFIECEHEPIKKVMKDKKYNFPTKFRIEEMVRFPREIGEMKDICKGGHQVND